MIKVTYTATREVTGLHAAGDIVEIAFSASEITPARRITRDVQVAIGGRRETLLHRALRAWSVTTGPLESEQVDQIVEFLASVEGGETFAFEPFNATPGGSLSLEGDFTCALDSEEWSLYRAIGHGNGGADDVYQISFQVIEAP